MNELDAYKIKQHRVFGEFLHEIKTPLSILRTHLESEITNESIPLETRKKLVLDVEEIARINLLINDVKFLLGESEAPERFQEENLLELVMDVIETLEPIASQKNQKMSLVSEYVCSIHGDKNRLKQLFYNLLSNAIKFSPEESRIDVVFEQKDDTLIISVTDNGIGISKEDQGKIFEAFYRVKDSQHEGVGLGLALCSAIVKMHHGRIELQSTLDGGSKFSVIFKDVTCMS